MRRSNSTRSTHSTYSNLAPSSNAERNRAASAAAAAAAALARSESRRSVDGPPAMAPGLVRRDSLNSVRSAATNISSRPGQYSAVRATGGKRLLASQAARQAGPPPAPSAQPPTATHSLQTSMRNKQSAPTSRRNVMPSNASVRSFQSDLERINEDYNKTYAYTGQTSASAMRSAATRGRRAESVISSAASDTSEIVDGVAPRRKGSRVSFSDIDENEVRSRGVSPSPANGPARSAMKTSAARNNLSAAVEQASPARLGIASDQSLMPPPALVRRGSNASLRSNTSTGMAPPLAKDVQIPSVVLQKPAEDQLSLSTIHSHGSVYSDADEDFRQSPAKSLQRNGVKTEVAKPLALTQQNLAAVDRAQLPASPLKSAMRKTTSQSGSVRFNKPADLESNLDADDESDDSFTRRRKAQRGTPRSMRTSLRSAPQTNGSSGFRQSITSPPAVQKTTQPALVRSNSNMSRMSAGGEPSRMRSLRKDPSSTNLSTRDAPAPMQRRTSLTSLRGNPPAATAARPGRAASVAGSVRDEAVDMHIAALAIAQRNVQKMLHPAASTDPVKSEADAILAADANKKQRRSSFERKRANPPLERRGSVMSVTSMADRTFRTTLRKDAPAPPPAVPTSSHRNHSRSQSSSRNDAAQSQRAERPKGRRSLSMLFGKSAHTNVDLSKLAASQPSAPVAGGSSSGQVTTLRATGADQVPAAPATPRSRFRRFSISLSGGKKNSPAVYHDATSPPPVPALPDIPPQPVFNPKLTDSGRRLSLDSDDGREQRPKRENKTGSALRAGSLRAAQQSGGASASDAAAVRPSTGRSQSGQTTATVQSSKRLSRLEVPPPAIPDKSAARSPSLPPSGRASAAAGFLFGNDGDRNHARTAGDSSEDEGEGVQVPTLQTVQNSNGRLAADPQQHHQQQQQPQAAGGDEGDNVVGQLSITRPPPAQRYQSELSISKRTGKPKKFQKLRRMLGIRD